MIRIEPGDTVFHRPSREWWLVLYVIGDRLAWCGWPPGEAKTADCLLVTKASPEERDQAEAAAIKRRAQR